MGQFDQFANQGGAAAWDPSERDEAKRLAEEQLNNADLSGEFPEPLGGEQDPAAENDAENDAETHSVNESAASADGADAYADADAAEGTDPDPHLLTDTGTDPSTGDADPRAN